MKEKDINSLDHTRWRCQYHVVFAPKYRRMAIYGEIKVDIGKILRQLCKQKGIEIIEAELCQDHVHMLISIPPKYSVSQIMGYLKGKSSLMIFDRHANLKYKYGNRHFWARGYFVDTVGRNKKQIQEYIRNQLTEDKIADLEEYVYDDYDDECDCDDCCDDDEEEFEVECPLCNTPFTVDAETALNGTVPCPNCGEMLEFEVEEADDEDAE